MLQHTAPLERLEALVINKIGLNTLAQGFPGKLVAVGSVDRLTVAPEWILPVPLHSEQYGPHQAAWPDQGVLPAGLCPRLREPQTQSQAQSPCGLQEVLVAKDRLAISVQPGSALPPSWPPWGARLPPTRKKNGFEPSAARSLEATLSGEAGTDPEPSRRGSSCVRGGGYMPKASSWLEFWRLQLCGCYS